MNKKETKEEDKTKNKKPKSDLKKMKIINENIKVEDEKQF